MKIGIISDTHGSLIAWQKAVEFGLNRVDLVIHCGDLLYHGPRNPLPEGYDPANLAKTLNTFSKPLICVQGNCDAEVDQMVLENVSMPSPFAQVFTEPWRILVHHGHLLDTTVLPSWASGYNLIISGHTHVPSIHKNGATVFLNPGSPALPKAANGIPTFALLDEDTIQLINLHNGEILEQI